MEILINILLGVVIITWLIFRYNKANKILKNWAKTNNYRILKSNLRFLFRGPFYITGYFPSVIYKLELEDSNAKVIKGWIKIGSMITGLISPVNTEFRDENY